MMLWPTLTLIGFMVLTVLVIAMGTSSTARYEQEQQATRVPTGRRTAEPAQAAA